MIRAINGFTPNGNISNNIAQFWQDTAPIRRIDGSALITGDLWKKTGREQAEWDGTRWVGTEFSLANLYTNSAVVNGANADILLVRNGANILITRIAFVSRWNIAGDVPFTLRYMIGAGAAYVNFASGTFNVPVVQTVQTNSIAINALLPETPTLNILWGAITASVTRMSTVVYGRNILS